MDRIERELDGILAGLPEWMRPAFLRLCQNGTSEYVQYALERGEEPVIMADGCVVVSLAVDLARQRVAVRAVMSYLLETGGPALLAGAMMAAGDATAELGG